MPIWLKSISRDSRLLLVVKKVISIVGVRTGFGS